MWHEDHCVMLSCGHGFMAAVIIYVRWSQLKSQHLQGRASWGPVLGEQLLGVSGKRRLNCRWDMTTTSLPKPWWMAPHLCAHRCHLLNSVDYKRRQEGRKEMSEGFLGMGDERQRGRIWSRYIVFICNICDILKGFKMLLKTERKLKLLRSKFEELTFRRVACWNGQPLLALTSCLVWDTCCVTSTL